MVWGVHVNNTNPKIPHTNLAIPVKPVLGPVINRSGVPHFPVSYAIANQTERIGRILCTLNQHGEPRNKCCCCACPHSPSLGSSLRLYSEECFRFERGQREAYPTKRSAPKMTKINISPNCRRNSTASGSGFKCMCSSRWEKSEDVTAPAFFDSNDVVLEHKPQAELHLARRVCLRVKQRLIQLSDAGGHHPM